MTNDEIKQLATTQDHGGAKEWCFTGESLLAFARALESRVLAERKQEPIYQVYVNGAWHEVERPDFNAFQGMKQELFTPTPRRMMQASGSA